MNIKEHQRRKSIFDYISTEYFGKLDFLFLFVEKLMVVIVANGAIEPLISFDLKLFEFFDISLDFKTDFLDLEKINSFGENFAIRDFFEFKDPFVHIIDEFGRLFQLFDEVEIILVEFHKIMLYMFLFLRIDPVSIHI